PGDPEVKKFAAPFFLDILDRQQDLHTIITTTNQHIEQHGYHLQVQKKDNATHLFCNLNGRRPVMREAQGYSIGEQRISDKELRLMITETPERFSPDVLLRPVFQSYLFPVLTQKGGPSEIAYLAQINPLFEAFGRVAPYYVARPSATLLEKRFQEHMAEYGITFEDLTGDIEQVINRVLVKSFPGNLEQSFESLKHDVERRFSDFVKESLEFDPSLKQFATRTYGKIDYQLKQFEGKVFSSHKKRSKETRERIYRLQQALFPNRGLQERTLNICYFLARYGTGLLQFLHDQIDCDESAHQVIHVAEYKP
ncbi:MAG: bacillithiol biosynthesis BshC, partial [Candidatus Zixiibacteriota bacterium]